MPQRIGDEYPDKRALDFFSQSDHGATHLSKLLGVREDPAGSQHFPVFSIMGALLPGTCHRCSTSGSTECPPWVVAGEYCCRRPTCRKCSTTNSSIPILYCANCSLRKNILHGVSLLLKQAQGSTDCSKSSGIQFTSSNLFSECNSRILTHCSHSGEKTMLISAALLLLSCPHNIDFIGFFLHIDLTHHGVPDYLVP